MTSVVIIDDNPEDQEWLSQLVKELGYEKITTFDNGTEGVEFVRKDLPQLVLLDDRLDDKRGFIYLPLIRAHHPEALVLLVTGEPFAGIEQICHQFKVGFLEKTDLSSEKLKDAIAHARHVYC